MRAPLDRLSSAAALWCAAALFPAIAQAQTEALPAIAKETFRPRPEVTTPVVPAVPAPIVVERTAVAPRVLAQPLATPPVAVVEKTVIEKPVGGAAVVVSPVAAWWTALARNRYGYYDDAFSDDDWYYDYYELPRPVPVAVERPAGTILGYRTTWTYEPAAEQALFSW